MSKMKLYFDHCDDDKNDNKDSTNFDEQSVIEPENQLSDDSIEVLRWTRSDVAEWVSQIGFSEVLDRIIEKGVDGKSLLSLPKEALRFSFGICCPEKLEKFNEHLNNLKQTTNFSSQDPTNLKSFLRTIDPEFTVYTYSMLEAGVDRNCLPLLSEYQLADECGITDSLHRCKILEAINGEKQLMERSLWKEHADEKLDGFISYRRSNGSEFASLLHLKLEQLGHSIFLDTECLGPGKFDNNLKQNIKRAKNFLLILTQNSLDRCIGDNDCNDWVHKEIVTAIEFNCNIIPILDNFQWPDVSTLPEDMQTVVKCKSVTWENENTDESVHEVDKFMRSNGTESDGPLSESSAGLSPQPKSWIRNDIVTDSSSHCENRSPKNSVVSIDTGFSKLPSDVLDLPCSIHKDEISEYTGIVYPSNAFEDGSKTDESINIGVAAIKLANTNNNTNNLYSNMKKTIRKTIRKFIPFYKNTSLTLNNDVS